MNKLQNFSKGLIKENPVLVLVLGTCPTLATSTKITDALGMGAAATVVLLCSNIVISALRKIIPDKVRIPCYIVLIAGFVTMVQMLVKAFAPALDKSLGIFLPLIVVNCIILGRAEAYALGAKPIPALFDGIGMGLGFTFALLLLGGFREIIGAGAIFGIPLIPEDFHISLFVLPPGAFLVMAFLTAAMQYYQDPDKGKKAEKYPSLEDVKTVVVKPAPKPAAPKPAAAAAPKAIEEKIPAPAPAAVKEAAKAAETVKKEAE